MKNVGFINPPSEFLINQRVFVTLGILRVATHLKKLNICNVSFLDLSNADNYKGVITNFIKSNDLHVVCFTATTPQIQVVYEFCQFISSNFEVKVLLGGPHVTLMHSSFKNGTEDIKKLCSDHLIKLLNCIDTVIIGDGEYAIAEAIHGNKKIINSEKNPHLFLKRNYDEVAIPDREFLDLSTYSYEIDGVKATNIISQMGCPYRCEFCSGRNSKTFSTIRKRSIGNIIEEIDILYTKYGYRGFMFYDDELNINKEYFEKLLKELIQYQKENGVSFNMRGFTRSDLLTERQAELMYQAGFKWLLIGFESGSDKILLNVNKGCTVADNSKCFDIAKNQGLKIKALMSIGHPGESEGTIQETIQWLQQVKPDETDVTIVSVYPGSGYFNKSIIVCEDKMLKYTNEKTNNSLYTINIDFLQDSNFYKSKADNYVSYVSTDYLTRDEIVEQRKLIESNGK